MITKRNFIAEEVPFDDLAKLGISKKNFLELNKQSLDKILSGGYSPVMEMKLNTDKGQVAFLGKIRLMRQNNRTTVRVMPARQEVEIKPQLQKQLQPQEIEALKNGDIVQKEIIRNGRKNLYTLQIDRETNNMLMARSRELMFPQSIQGVELGIEQRKQMREGKAVELSVGNSKVTVGVDLREAGGIKIMQGDMMKWERERAIRWDYENPGKMGYLQTSENGWEYQQSIQKYCTPEMRQQTQKVAAGLKR